MKTKLPHIICLLALLVFHSCSHDDFDRGKDKSSHSVGEARAYFENNATNLTMPLLLMPASTKNEDIFAEGNLVPVWKDCAVAETDRFSIFEVPIARDFAMEAAMFHHGNGIHSFVTENVKVCSSLVIRKNRTTGTADFFVVTTIGFLTAQGNRDDNPWKYMGDRANFNGYMIVSDVEGEVLEAFYYRGGNRYFISLTNHVHGGSAGTDLFGFTVRRTAPTTKGGGWYDPGESQELCPHCKRPLIDYICDCPGWLDNTVVTGEYIYCDGCGMLKGKCICRDNSCPVCGKEPCECSESSSCHLCGSRYCNGECSDLGNGGRGGGDEPEPPSPEQPQDLYTVVIAEPVGGTVMGAGEYKKGSIAAISATPALGYVFAGWSGDYSGLDNPASFTVNDDMTIYAKFYEENSECGKLIKNLESLPYMTRCREKIGSGTGLTEYGYIKTSSSIEELTGRDNAIAIPDMPNTIELAHTHIDVVHPSIDDLKSIYRRYYKGCISDYENFKYIIVSPEYFVILKIEDIDRMDVLIRDSLIIQRMLVGNNKYKYEFSKNIRKKYYEYIPAESNSVEGHFSNFMRFFEYLNPGLSVSIYKTDAESGNVFYRKVNNKEDFNNLIRKIGVCNN